MSSRAYLVDLIHSIGEKTALADHLEEKLGEDENIKHLLSEVLNLRREQMNMLLSLADEPHPEFWCAFKHSVKTWTLDCEIYEATMSEEAYEAMKKSSDILASMISLFLGMEFEECARCVYDKLLVKEINNKENIDV